MAKEKLVRVIGRGIYGAPTKESPSGELLVGAEFPISGEIPAGWKGRVALVGKEPAEGSELITNEGEDVEKVRAELIAKAQKHIDGLNAEHTATLKSVNDRADKAEKDLATAFGTIDGLKAELAELAKLPGSEAEDLSAKTVAELKALAEAETIDLGDATKKPDIIAAIQLGREANK